MAVRPDAREIEFESDGRKLRASVLAESIEDAGRAEMRSRARDLGLKMQSENGLRNAVIAIETMMNK